MMAINHPTTQHCIPGEMNLEVKVTKMRFPMA
jgi:hypothetical protein